VNVNAASAPHASTPGEDASGSPKPFWSDKA